MENEVIIDGCNVAECEFYDYKYCKLCDMKAALDELIVHRQYCDRTINQNCYFKQLQKAKAENERLKEDKKQLLKDCNSCNFHKYKKALEEVREIVSEPCIEGENCLTCNGNCQNKDILIKIDEVLG